MSRIDEIRERWSNVRRASDVAILQDEIDVLTGDVAVLLGEIDKLQKWLSMSCVTPVEHCTCTGCRYAAEAGYGQEFEVDDEDG